METDDMREDGETESEVGAGAVKAQLRMRGKGSSQSCKLCGSSFASEFGLLLHFHDEHLISKRKVSEADVALALLLSSESENELESESEQESDSDEEPDQARLMEFLSDLELILLQESICPSTSTSESEEVAEESEWEDIFDKVINRVLPSSKPYEPEPGPADYLSSAEEDTNLEAPQVGVLNFLSDREPILLQETISPPISESETSEEDVDDLEEEEAFDKGIVAMMNHDVNSTEPDDRLHEPEPVTTNYRPTSAKRKKVAVLDDAVQAWVNSIPDGKTGDFSPDSTKSKAKTPKPSRKIIKGKPINGTQATEDGQKDHPNACIFCGKTFLWNCRFFDHIRRSHTLERPYFCKLCDHSSAYLNNLLIHMNNRHAGATPYKCKFCPRSFHSPGLLRFHVSVHKKEANPKSFKCSTCDQKLTTKQNLDRHMVIHSEDRRKLFECDQCDARYYWKKSLDAHMKTQHASEKPFQCDLCKKRFIRGNTLRSHIKRFHDPGMLFGCQLCEEKFSSREDLRIHRSLSHPESVKRRGRKRRSS